jgi:hypothetical protein
MESSIARITIQPPNNEIQQLLNKAGESCSYTSHFNQNEDFFIKLSKPITVPSFPIHHPVTLIDPPKSYTLGVHQVLTQLIDQAGSIFRGLTYFFDPREHLRLGFYRLYKAEEQLYLYLIKLDLTYHPSRHSLLEQGDNDHSPKYETTIINLEADFIPVDPSLGGDKSSDTKIFSVSQSISDTWIGETGRGYFLQGIWLDRDLTKFFSRLFIPKKKNLYPYYPFTCKYRAVCHSVVLLDSEGRKQFLPLVHRGRAFLIKHMDAIEEALRTKEFAEDLESFLQLYDKVPDSARNLFLPINLELYLNDKEMREYKISYEPLNDQGSETSVLSLSTGNNL